MTNYLYRLQVLRFVAAAMVLLGHAQLKVREVQGITLGAYQPFNNLVFFASGVDIFFVLSGFIMYAISRDEFGRPGASRNFFLRRLARIGPPYWLFTTAMVCAALLLGQHVSHNQLALDNVIASYLFVPWRNNYDEWYPVLALGWTLNFEMLFYVLFAIGLRWPASRGLGFIVLAVGGLGVLGAVAPPSTAPLAVWCNPIVFEFLFGIGLARVYISGWRWPRGAALTVLATGIVLLYLGSSLSAPSTYWTPRALWMGIPALLICASAALVREAAVPGPIGRAFAFAGDASYALYLSHPFSLVALGLVWRYINLSEPWTFIVTAVLFSVAISMVFHRWIEQPVTLILNRWIKNRIGRSASPTRGSLAARESRQ